MAARGHGVRARPAARPALRRSALKRAPALHVALAVVVRRGRVLVAKREPGAHCGGLWEFPGGKVRRREPPAVAAARELREETGVRARPGRRWMRLRHAYPDRTVLLDVFLMTSAAGAAPLPPARWVDLARVAKLPMPAANRPIATRLAALGERRAVRGAAPAATGSAMEVR